MIGHYVGMDFGYRNPTVILWAALDEAGTIFVLDEVHAAGVTIQDHTRTILAGHAGHAGSGRGPWPAPGHVACDPSGENHDAHGRSCVTTLRESGLRTVHHRMTILEGVDLVRARLRPADGSPPRLFVDERCTHMIESLLRYHFREGDPSSLVPVKDGFDHAADALRYLVRSLDKSARTASGNYS